MKKKFLLGVAGVAFLSLSMVSVNVAMDVMSNANSETTPLACRKCNIANRKCACGGHLNAKCLEIKGNKAKWEYKCSKCKHIAGVQWEPYK